MTLQWFRFIFSKNLISLSAAIVLTACSIEEDLPSFADEGANPVVEQVATPHTTPPTPAQVPTPVPEPIPTPVSESAPTPPPTPIPAPVPAPEPEPTPEPPPPGPVGKINTPAVIYGVDTGSVTEDQDPDRNNLLEVSGKLNITDSDVGESAFKSNTRPGRYGNLRINANGQWSYKASNSQNAIQSLAAGARLTDRIPVSSLDGTTHNVTVTIIGSNDTPVFRGVKTGDVTEDVDPNGDNLLEVSGKLSINDRDNGESAFRPTTRDGSYGTLRIDASGTWRYAANNQQAAIQSLKNGSSITDTINVSSVDGSIHDVRIRIQGSNDTTTITGVATGIVTEDVDPDGDNLLEVSGKLTIRDPDSGESGFKAATHSGSYGSLSIQANGNWRYQASNQQTAIQALKSGSSITDTIKVLSLIHI